MQKSRRHSPQVLGARPIDLFVAEAAALRPLPLHVPEVYRLHTQSVDDSAACTCTTTATRCQSKLFDRALTLHETKDRVRIFDGHRLVCEHVREAEGACATHLLEAHKLERRRARQGVPKQAPRPEEVALSASSPAMASMVAAMKKRHGGRAVRALSRLRRMWIDYPSEPLEQALAVALAHGFDLARIERVVLQHVAGNFFRLPDVHAEEDDSSHE